MSKHNVQYFSNSKRRMFYIEELSDWHLCSAFNALGEHVKESAKPSPTPIEDPQPDGADRVLAALASELAFRKLDPQYKGGMAPDDPRVAGGVVKDKREEVRRGT